MNQLRHHRQRRYVGSSFATSLDFSPNGRSQILNNQNQQNNNASANMMNYDSRKSGDKLSNIMRLGIQTGSGSTSLVNPPPSVP